MQNTLDNKQQAIIPIAAFAAIGETEKLTAEIHTGLDAGLSINEIKEVLIQLYAYAGFPRSLNALGALMRVVEQRKQQGITDNTGPEASPFPANWHALEGGAQNQTRLIGQPVTGPLFAFAPAIDQFLKAHLFGDIFQRDNLSWQTRELATVSFLAAIPGVSSQLKSHFAISLNAGLTAEQLWLFTAILEQKCGAGMASTARAVLSELPGKTPALSTPASQAPLSTPFDGNGIFPRGEKNEAYAQYFNGTSYLSMLSLEGVKIGNVVFEPACRNDWHIHHKGGQILIVTGGRGWYQAWQEPARQLTTGDVVNIPAETKHWHGAAKDSWFAHIAIEVPAEGGSSEWLEPVSDEDYTALP